MVIFGETSKQEVLRKNIEIGTIFEVGTSFGIGTILDVFIDVEVVKQYKQC